MDGDAHIGAHVAVKVGSNGGAHFSLVPFLHLRAVYRPVVSLFSLLREGGVGGIERVVFIRRRFRSDLSLYIRAPELGVGLSGTRFSEGEGRFTSAVRILSSFLNNGLRAFFDGSFS